MSDVPPLIYLAIAPKFESEQERLALALIELAAEDSSLRVSTDQESGQTIIAGMGELHLDHKVDVLKRTYNLEVDIGAPQIAYRETVSGHVTKDHIYKKLSGASGEFARIKIACKPLPAGGGVLLDTRRAGGALPNEFIAGVEKGLESVLGAGVLAGFRSST
jgi:elongation factor G